MRNVKLKRHKSFYEQVKDCTKANAIRIEFCPSCAQEIPMCLKYGGICESKKCRIERGVPRPSGDFLIEVTKKIDKKERRKK